jgi:hypothetical protein
MTSTGADAILADATDKTDYKQFVGAELVGFTVSSCTAALARIAAGDVVLRSTDANANTDTLAVWATMPSILRSTAGKGYKLTSVKAFYRIYTGAATTVAFTVKQATLSTSAPVVADHGGTLTLDAAEDTEPERIATGYHAPVATLGTPAFNVTSGVQVTADILFTFDTATDLDFYGFEFAYTADLL